MNQMKVESSLSIIIPAYNEENAIKPVIMDLIETMNKSQFKFEIIVVDDGSTDKTADTISKIPEIKVVQHKFNRGYGAALKSGVKAAKYNDLCITDADGTYPNDRIPDLYFSYKKDQLDMIIGARNLTDSSLIRRPAKWLLKKLAEYLSETKIPDLNSGLRIFDKKKAIGFQSIFPNGFSYTTTITLSMLNSGCSVGFSPISYFKRIGKSKIHPIKDTKNFFILILKMSLFFRPLKIFFPLSFFLFSLSLGWGVFSYIWLEKLADVSTMVLFIGSVQVGATGLLAELINRRTPTEFYPNMEDIGNNSLNNS